MCAFYYKGEYWTGEELLEESHIDAGAGKDLLLMLVLERSYLTIDAGAGQDLLGETHTDAGAREEPTLKATKKRTLTKIVLWLRLLIDYLLHTT